jgi:hypothetical protein
VAKGFAQVPGEHFGATFAPTATFLSIRVLLTLAELHKWPVHTFDFVAVYLNLPINEEIWVAPLEGLRTLNGEECLLKKALYGTQQAGHCWWQHLSKNAPWFGVLKFQI